MSKIYTDYINMTALTIPDKFIDVKTGDSHLVSAKIQEQIEYHTNNNTLIHLVLSALNSYLHPNQLNGGMGEILFELTEIKKMMLQGYNPKSIQTDYHLDTNKIASTDLDMKDLEDILEIFGG